MSVTENFWAKVDKGDGLGCWLWTAGRKGNGYGSFRAGYPHRLAYEWLVGPIPPGCQIDHVCHNRACVNPAHLRPCSAGENSRNSLTKSSNVSGLKGVHRHQTTGKWIAQITVNGQGMHLGVFDSPEAAHAAYLQAARDWYGEFACDGARPKLFNQEAS